MEPRQYRTLNSWIITTDSVPICDIIIPFSVYCQMCVTCFLMPHIEYSGKRQIMSSYEATRVFFNLNTKDVKDLLERLTYYVININS